MSLAANLAAHEACAVHYCPEIYTLKVTGPDRATWLNGLITCDARKVQPGRAEWGLALNRTGKIQSVLWLVADSETLWVGAAAGTGPTLLAEFERMLVMEDAEVSAAAEPLQWAWVLGPKGADVAWGSEVRWGSADVFGLGGWLALGPAADLQSALQGVPTLDDEAWQTLRLERGVVQWAHEFDSAERPHEAGLERRAVDWQKGCYLGQEVVCMQDMRGKVSRRVERLRLDGLASDPSPTGMPIHAKGDAKVLGKVATAVFSRRAEAWLGFAMLPVPLPDNGVVLGAPDATRGGQRVETLY